jgi:hypothetical protein
VHNFALHVPDQPGLSSASTALTSPDSTSKGSLVQSQYAPPGRSLEHGARIPIILFLTIGAGMDDLNKQAVLLALQDHIEAGRTPAEAAGEVQFLDELMAIVSEDEALKSRRIIELWLAEALNVSPDELGPHLAVSKEYMQFLRERVTMGRGLEWMQKLDESWREWRRTQ